jgi:hypothetical protein
LLRFEVRGCKKIEVVGFGFEEEGEQEKLSSKDVGWWEDQFDLTEDRREILLPPYLIFTRTIKLEKYHIHYLKNEFYV